MANITQDYPIKNTHVYQFSDGTYYVCFDANNIHHEFQGSRDQILPQMALRIKRVLHIRQFDRV